MRQFNSDAVQQWYSSAVVQFNSVAVQQWPLLAALPYPAPQYQTQTLCVHRTPSDSGLFGRFGVPPFPSLSVESLQEAKIVVVLLLFRCTVVATDCAPPPYVFTSPRAGKQLQPERQHQHGPNPGWNWARKKGRICTPSSCTRHCKYFRKCWSGKTKHYYDIEKCEMPSRTSFFFAFRLTPSQ